MLNDHLQFREWMEGGAYGIADIASWGWVWCHRMQGQDSRISPKVPGWFFALSERPAVARGRMLRIETQSEENRARFIRPYYGANGPAPGAT